MSASSTTLNGPGQPWPETTLPNSRCPAGDYPTADPAALLGQPPHGCSVEPASLLGRGHVRGRRAVGLLLAITGVPGAVIKPLRGPLVDVNGVGPARESPAHDRHQPATHQPRRRRATCGDLARAGRRYRCGPRRPARPAVRLVPG